MNIKDLKYLIAVADYQHFGHAAQQCHVSQPTLSMQLKKLEDELGVVIFERDNKQFLITPIGEKIIKQARVILGEVATLSTLVVEAQDPFVGDFRLGIIPTLGPYLLPIILPVIKYALPKLNVILTENKTDVIVKQLQEGELDAIILALPIHEAKFKQQLLFAEPFYLAMPAAHPLCKKEKITLSDLKDEDLLLLEEGHCLRDQALAACQLANVGEKQGFRATSLETIRHMVAAGFGMTLLPELAVKYTLHRTDIVSKPFASPSPKRDIGMLWRNICTRQPCCEAIANAIQQKMDAL